MSTKLPETIEDTEQIIRLQQQELSRLHAHRRVLQVEEERRLRQEAAARGEEGAEATVRATVPTMPTLEAGFPTAPGRVDFGDVPAVAMPSVPQPVPQPPQPPPPPTLDPRSLAFSRGLHQAMTNQRGPQRVDFTRRGGR